MQQGVAQVVSGRSKRTHGAPFAKTALAPMRAPHTGIAVQDFFANSGSRVIVVAPGGGRLRSGLDLVASRPHGGVQRQCFQFPRRLHSPTGRAVGLGPVAARGVMAGVVARTDALQSVWKAPGGRRMTRRSGGHRALGPPAEPIQPL
jgi:hypothetical protein